MMLKALFKTKFMLVLSLLTAIGLLSFQGCDDSGVEPLPPTDTSIVFFDNVAPMYWFQGTNDTSHMGVNIIDGVTERQLSNFRDMELIDFQSDTANFRFRSGDLSLDAIGFKTRFNQIYNDMDTTQFDSLSVIPDSDTLLTPADFTQDDTWGNGVWNFFTIDQIERPVYSFYLQGRNTSGTNYIYGVFHVKQVVRVYSSLYSSYGVMITIDIKLNKAGKNKFTK